LIFDIPCCIRADNKGIPQLKYSLKNKIHSYFRHIAIQALDGTGGPKYFFFYFRSVGKAIIPAKNIYDEKLK
jgi:hypothetical protein